MARRCLSCYYGWNCDRHEVRTPYPKPKKKIPKTMDCEK